MNSIKLIKSKIVNYVDEKLSVMFPGLDKKYVHQNYFKNENYIAAIV